MGWLHNLRINLATEKMRKEREEEKKKELLRNKQNLDKNINYFLTFQDKFEDDNDLTSLMYNPISFKELIKKLILHLKLKNQSKTLYLPRGFISIKGLKFEIWCRNGFNDISNKKEDFHFKGNLIDYNLDISIDNSGYGLYLNIFDKQKQQFLYKNCLGFPVMTEQDRVNASREFITYYNNLISKIFNLCNQPYNDDNFEQIFCDIEDEQILQFLKLNHINIYNNLECFVNNHYFYNLFFNNIIADYSINSIQEIEELAKQLREDFNLAKTLIFDATNFIKNKKLEAKYEKLTNNFIKMLPSNYLLNIRNIKHFKLLITQLYPEINYIVNFNSKSQNFLEEDDDIIYKNQEIESIIENVVEIICNDCGLDNSIPSLTIVYQLIKNNIKTYYSNLARNEFNLSSDNYLSSYLSNKHLVFDDELNILKLSYYSLINDNKYNSLEDAFDNLIQAIKIQGTKEKNIAIKNKLLSDLAIDEKNKISIEDIDKMNGVEFENFISKLFFNEGYKSKVTKTSRDQGIDVILEKNGKNIGIQCKCYTGKVSNSAIQEAVAGKLFYNLDEVMVVTNSYFTKSAKDLAQVNNVKLWDRDILRDKLNLY